MLFNKKFKVVEIHKNGVKITTYLSGSKKNVNKDIEMYKKESKDYEMVGRDGMIVWA